MALGRVVYFCNVNVLTLTAVTMRYTEAVCSVHLFVISTDILKLFGSFHTDVKCINRLLI